MLTILVTTVYRLSLLGRSLGHSLAGTLPARIASILSDRLKSRSDVYYHEDTWRFLARGSLLTAAMLSDRLKSRLDVHCQANAWWFLALTVMATATGLFFFFFYCFPSSLFSFSPNSSSLSLRFLSKLSLQFLSELS